MGGGNRGKRRARRQDIDDQLADREPPPGGSTCKRVPIDCGVDDGWRVPAWVGLQEQQVGGSLDAFGGRAEQHVRLHVTVAAEQGPRCLRERRALRGTPVAGRLRAPDAALLERGVPALWFPARARGAVPTI